MEFGLTDEQAATFDMVRDFGYQNIAPNALNWEQAGCIPKELWPRLGKLGLGGIYVRADSGGSGLTRVDATLVFEALSLACPSVSAFLSIHNMCAWMIDQFGSPELRKKYLVPAIELSKVFSYCLTEPGSGSDAAALKSKAERTNFGWTLNGNKAFISGGGYSDSYIVMCRTGRNGPGGISAMVVDSDALGLSFGALEEKMGWRAQPTRQVVMDNCKIPAENLLGTEGSGFKYAMSGLDGGRLNIAACSLGGAQSALNRTIEYMRTRQAFGKTLDKFQALRFRLADLETELQAARVFLRQAAWKLDEGATDASMHCAMAKRFVTDAGFKVANDCLQLHGGYGYLTPFGIEKVVRDLRVHQILEGTNEIMRLIVSRKLLDE